MRHALRRRQWLNQACAIGLATLVSWNIGLPQAAAAPGNVTAIDILLEPDATMLEKAETTNARLLRAYPQGFALDDTHRPHITVIQRFVRTADLDKVYAAANDVLAQSKVRQMRLEAFRYFYLPSGATGLAAIVARPTPALLALQADLLAAVAPYTAETGDSTAFVTTPEDPVIDPVLIAYVSTYDSIAAGRKYSPHVTTGVALKADLDKMLAQPFEAFSFAPAGAAVYQLGQFGTASKKLKQLDFPK